MNTTKRIGQNLDTGMVHYMATDGSPACQRNSRRANLLDGGKVELYELPATEDIASKPRRCHRCGV